MAGIGRELCFTLDNFQQPKMLGLKETVARMILNLFFMRPGNLPSLPHIGIDIEQYMYRLENDFDPEEIKEKLYSNCSELMPFISLGEVRIFITSYQGKDVLIASVPIVGLDEDDSTLIVGFTKTNTSELSVAYEFQKAIKNM